MSGTNAGVRGRLIGLGCGVLFLAGIAAWALSAPEAEHVIGSYSTSLNGRTESQIHNVRLAAGAINNTVLMPGQVFSFNRKVGSWTADRGYRKAPVSYDGELVRSWGGGVCQASTTLYNAALLAGLQIVQRSRHHWPARYAPLGRDAAVAYEDIDLKFRNNLPQPIRIVASVRGETAAFSILSSYRPEYKVQVESQVKSVIRPGEVIQGSSTLASGRRVINRGHPGFYVVTCRTFTSPSGSRREFVSEDRYPAMNRVVRLTNR